MDESSIKLCECGCGQPVKGRFVKGHHFRMHAKVSSLPNLKRRRRRRRGNQVVSLDAEIRRSAKQIYESGMAEAMRAAALMIVARKLDEVRQLLVAGGLSSEAVPTTIPGAAYQPAARPSPLPSPPPVANPCVNCGRPGIYKTKPNQFNRTGSWFCRTHMVLGANIEAEDKADRAIQPAPLAPPDLLAQAAQAGPAPGASTLAEAMGMAELVNE